MPDATASDAAHASLLERWDPLLVRLADVPRENGTAALHETANFLAGSVEAAGLVPELVAFTAYPWSLRIAGVVVLVGTLVYMRLMGAGRSLAAFALIVAVSGALLLDLERHRPVFSWLGSETQYHVTTRVAPTGAAERRIAFAAHYDTKTDLLDHDQRAPAEWLAAPTTALMLLAAGLAWWRPGSTHVVVRGIVRVVPWLGVAFGVLYFAVLSAGAFVPARSPGALDDGAACAVMVRLAEELAARPLERTEVELWWLSAEEVGVQGSWAFARERFATPPALPTSVVNLESLGAAPGLMVNARESFTLHSYPADPALVAQADRVHRARNDEPIPVEGTGATDARSFLAHGVPALTLLSDLRGHPHARGLHSRHDDRSRLDLAALEEHVAFLADLARLHDEPEP